MKTPHTTVSISRNTDPAQAVAAALAALPAWDREVQRHPHILIKPNLCGGVAGEPGSHTAMPVLEAVLAACAPLGLPLYVGEADCSFNRADAMFRALGVHEVAKKHNARVVNLSKGSCCDVPVPDPLNLKTLRIAEVLRDAYIISVPVLKTHPWSGVTVTMKNMYGAVYPPEKSVYHSGLEENIVDIIKVIAPHLSVVDATMAVVRGGFKYGLWVGCPASRLDCIFAGVNPVAVDTVGARMLGRDPYDIGHISIAARTGLGPCDLSQIELTGDTSLMGI